MNQITQDLQQCCITSTPSRTSHKKIAVSVPTTTKRLTQFGISNPPPHDFRDRLSTCTDQEYEEWMSMLIKCQVKSTHLNREERTSIMHPWCIHHHLQPLCPVPFISTTRYPVFNDEMVYKISESFYKLIQQTYVDKTSNKFIVSKFIVGVASAKPSASTYVQLYRGIMDRYEKKYKALGYDNVIVLCVGCNKPFMFALERDITMFGRLQHGMAETDTYGITDLDTTGASTGHSPHMLYVAIKLKPQEPEQQQDQESQKQQQSLLLERWKSYLKLRKEMMEAAPKRFPEKQILTQHKSLSTDPHPVSSKPLKQRSSKTQNDENIIPSYNHSITTTKTNLSFDEIDYKSSDDYDDDIVEFL